MSILTSRQKKKYFSFLDNSTLPSINCEKDSLKATVNLLRKNKFIYLDLNATNGFKPMEQSINV